MKRERLVYLDYLRAIATFFVIGVHTVSLGASLVPERSTDLRWQIICSCAVTCCLL